MSGPCRHPERANAATAILTPGLFMAPLLLVLPLLHLLLVPGPATANPSLFGAPISAPVSGPISGPVSGPISGPGPFLTVPPPGGTGGARSLLDEQPARIIMNRASGALIRPGAAPLLPVTPAAQPQKLPQHLPQALPQALAPVPATASPDLPAGATLEQRMEAGIASLFADRARSGFFAPMPPRSAPRSPARGGGGTDLAPIPFGPQAEMLKHLIARAEAGRAGYDAVQLAAAIRPAKRPTAMTLGEIYDWIAATPGQHHAIGRYQFIPATLRRLAAQLGQGRNARFSPALQDRLADLLLEEAGYSAFRSGQLSRHGFMNNLARIWAGLPTSSGRSYYEGYAGNSAVLSWARFDAEMARIFRG